MSLVSGTIGSRRHHAKQSARCSVSWPWRPTTRSTASTWHLTNMRWGPMPRKADSRRMSLPAYTRWSTQRRPKQVPP